METNKLTIEAAIDFGQLLQLIDRLSSEQKDEIFDMLRKERMARLMDKFEANLPQQEPDISEEEIIAEVRAYRQEKAENEKKEGNTGL